MPVTSSLPRLRTSALTRRIGVTLVGTVFPPLTSLAVAPLLAHGLGVDGRGAVAGVVAPLLLVTMFAQVGVPTAVTHLVARNAAAARLLLRRGCVLLIGAGAVGWGILMLALPLLGPDGLELAGLIRVGAIALVPTLLVAVLQGVASGLHAWRLVAAERIVGSSVRLGGIAVLGLSGQMTLTGVVVVLTFAPVLGGVAYAGLIRRAGQAAEAEGVESKAGSYRGILAYGLPVWLGALSGVALTRLDQVVLVPLTDLDQLGLYAVAVTIGELPLVLNTAVRDVVFASASGDFDAGQLARMARLSTLAVAAAALPLAVTGPFWLPLVFGAGFDGALPMATLLLVAAVVANPGSVAGAGLAALGRPGLRSLSLAIAAVVNVLVLVVLVPTIGGLGAAVATLVAGLVASHLNIVLLRRVSDARVGGFYGFRRHDWVRIAIRSRVST